MFLCVGVQDLMMLFRCKQNIHKRTTIIPTSSKNPTSKS